MKIFGVISFVSEDVRPMMMMTTCFVECVEHIGQISTRDHFNFDNSRVLLLLFGSGSFITQCEESISHASHSMHDPTSRVVDDDMMERYMNHLTHSGTPFFQPSRKKN